MVSISANDRIWLRDWTTCRASPSTIMLDQFCSRVVVRAKRKPRASITREEKEPSKSFMAAPTIIKPCSIPCYQAHSANSVMWIQCSIHIYFQMIDRRGKPPGLIIKWRGRPIPSEITNHLIFLPCYPSFLIDYIWLPLLPFKLILVSIFSNKPAHKSSEWSVSVRIFVRITPVEKKTSTIVENSIVSSQRGNQEKGIVSTFPLPFCTKKEHAQWFLDPCDNKSNRGHLSLVYDRGSLPQPRHYAHSARWSSVPYSGSGCSI